MLSGNNRASSNVYEQWVTADHTQAADREGQRVPDWGRGTVTLKHSDQMKDAEKDWEK